MDINCDLGEGESNTRTLMRWIGSANIACGGHAGDARSMRRCLRLCREFGVNAGAHPGFADPENFGRLALPISASQLENLLAQQLGAFELLARMEGITPTHVKLHGALYHVVEKNSSLARVYIDCVKQWFPRWKVYAAPTGQVSRCARKAGVTVWGEIFADRAYLADGSLVPREAGGAVLHDLPLIRSRLEEFVRSGRLAALDGTVIPLEAKTICVHADSPHAVGIARVLGGVFSGPTRSKP